MLDNGKNAIKSTGDQKENVKIPLLHGADQLLQERQHDQKTQIHVQIPERIGNGLPDDPADKESGVDAGNFPGVTIINIVYTGKQYQTAEDPENQGKGLAVRILPVHHQVAGDDDKNGNSDPAHIKISDRNQPDKAGGSGQKDIRIGMVDDDQKTGKDPEKFDKDNGFPLGLWGGQFQENPSFCCGRGNAPPFYRDYTKGAGLVSIPEAEHGKKACNPGDSTV